MGDSPKVRSHGEAAKYHFSSISCAPYDAVHKTLETRSLADLAYIYRHLHGPLAAPSIGASHGEKLRKAYGWKLSPLAVSPRYEAEICVEPGSGSVVIGRCHLSDRFSMPGMDASFLLVGVFLLPATSGGLLIVEKNTEIWHEGSSDQEIRVLY